MIHAPGSPHRRIRVAIVAPSLRILGGQAVQADRLLRAWRDDPDVEAWLVPVNPTPPAWLRWALEVKYLRTIVTELTYLPSLVGQLARADVVHVFSASYWSYLLAPLPAMLAGRALRRPVLLNYRSGEASDHLARSAIARATIRRVTRNVVPSRYLVEVFREFSVDADIVPNVVELERFAFRERTPLRPHLLSTRNFDGLYNVACTIRAFAIVQRRYPDATLALVGGGPEEASLRSLVADLRLRNVTFAGRSDPGAIADYYAANDIYIQSPNLDNMPTSVIEAFASGMPVVSTEAGGVPALLTHEQHGLLAPLEDERTLAACVLNLLDNPDRARSMALAARTVAERCAWPLVRPQWLRIYQELVADTRRIDRRERRETPHPARSAVSALSVEDSLVHERHV